MPLVVLANDESRSELLEQGIREGMDVQWIQHPQQFADYPDASGYIDLSFEKTDERIAILSGLNKAPIIVSSVLWTLQDLPEHTVRINGWPTFLKRQVVEAAGNDTEMKGEAKNGADDFIMAEPNYVAALNYYNNNGFTYINLGDCEELWENSLGRVKKFNEPSFRAERDFIPGGRFIKIYGNHDLYWDNDPLAWYQLKDIYKEKIKVYEGVVLHLQEGSRKVEIFCTHGHQGDSQSDGNWFSKFFVARIWAPFQAYLLINPNTPAYDKGKKSLHNDIMYQWASSQKDMLVITGHTHQPVFASLTHLERLYKDFQHAQADKNTEAILSIQTEIRKRESDFATVSLDYMNMKPSYFNSGCCCYTDGDITGIEIDAGKIRLIKWKTQDDTPTREILEEMPLEKLLQRL